MARALSLSVLALVLAPAAAISDAESSCNAGGSGSADSVDVALVRRGSAGVSLMQHRGALSVTSVLRVDAARIAAHVRSRRSTPADLAASLQAGLEAFDAASALWMADPPQITEGVATLAVQMFDAVKSMIPEDVRATPDFAEFEREWMQTFARLPSVVQSVEEDIRAFAHQGDSEKLARAINTMLLEAGAVVSRLLPEGLGDEVAKYLGAIVDLVDGVADGIQAFAEGETAAAIEAIYEGLRAATRDLLPAEAQDDEAYQAVVTVLDGTLGSLSRHVLAYRQQIEQSSVCWKGFKSRERGRPSQCDEGYTWDGEQWCLYREASPYTIQSVASGHYLNVYSGSRSDGANVVVWDNPDSQDTQWRLEQAADGTYTIRNVNGNTYLHAAGGDENGANVQTSSDAAGADSRWRLVPTDEAGVFAIRSASTGRYLSLQGGRRSRGVNVQLSDSPGGSDGRWRIAEARGGAPFEPPSAPLARGPVLLEHTVAAKRPQGALPARCDPTSAFTEKRGSWCYEMCPAGYEPSAARCKATCSTAFPVDSALMCGRTQGSIAAATARMITETLRSAITLGSLLSSMTSAGLEAATGLRDTMQAFVDMGLPFAHPTCPV